MGAIFVTGAARGIGRKIIDLALQDGHKVIGTIRKEQDKGLFPENENLKLVLVHTDDYESVKAGFRETDAWLGNSNLTAVIHCAAIAPQCTVEFMDPDLLISTLKTNTCGTLHIFKESIPRLRGTGGTILIASSLWGKIAGPVVSAYSASKHAIEALTDSARRETMNMGLNIVIAQIGVVKTDMLIGQVDAVEDILKDVSEEERKLYGGLYRSYVKLVQDATEKALTAEAAATKLLKIACKSKPRTRYTVGIDAMVTVFLGKILPDRIFDKIFNKTLKNEYI